MAVITLTTGVPGCGKTYVRAARFIVDHFLLDTDGHYYTNFPLNIDEIINEVHSRQKILSKFSSFFLKKSVIHEKEYYQKRLHIIPDYVLQAWRSHQSGPWEYFFSVDLKNAHIAIDEIHNFISKRDDSDKDYVKQWDDFLGEIRHRGCTFEGITQDIDQVSSVFTGRCSLRLELIPCEDLRDPYFKIIMSDWYNLKAAFTGSFHKTVFEVEKRKNGSGRWKVNYTRRFLIIPDYFKFYNSYEASLQDKANGITNSDAPLYEFQKRTKIGLFFWFIRKNFFNLFFRIILILLFIWLCFFGGFRYLITNYLSISNSISKSNTGVKKNDPQVLPESSPEVSVDPFSDFYEKDLSSFLPALFIQSNKLVILRNGTKIFQDFIFPPGTILQGKKVIHISFTDRFFILDSGHVLRMRYIRPEPSSSKEEKDK